MPERSEEPDSPSLLERVGCFLFVALPLVFGLPVAMAWARVLGLWLFHTYILLMILVLAFVIFTLEREG